MQACLDKIRRRLRGASAIAKGAFAESGSEREALRIAMDRDGV